VDSVDEQWAGDPVGNPDALALIHVISDVAVQHEVIEGEAVAERRKKREQHVAALELLKPFVLDVVNPAEIVGRDVFSGASGDPEMRPPPNMYAYWP
jgi:hypothetical protein